MRGGGKRKIPDRGLVCSGWDVTRPGFRAGRGAMMQELLTEAFCVCDRKKNKTTTTRSALENVSASRPRTNAPTCMYVKTGLETDTVTKPPAERLNIQKNDHNMFSACDGSNVLSCEFENTLAEPLSRCITAASAGRTDRVFWQGVLSGGGASTSTTDAGRTRRDQKQAAFGCKLHFQLVEKKGGMGNELCACDKNIRSKIDGTISIGFRFQAGSRCTRGGTCSISMSKSLVVNVVGETAGIFFFTHKGCMRERERGAREG